MAGFQIPSWEDINRRLGLGNPLTTAHNKVVGGESYDSHIQEYYSQQSDMLMKENTSKAIKLAFVGVGVLALIYFIKKKKGR